MKKLVVATFMSLDGITENPSWTFPYWNDEIAKFKYDELFGSDALLLGRITYEGFAAAWPGRTDAQGYADRMNNLPKYVVSDTLDLLEWNNSHLIKTNVIEEIRKLKQQDGQDLLLFGSATLVDALLQYGLVDVVNLLVYPVVIGGGKRLFKDGTQAKLKLVETRSFSSGVVALTYHPEPVTK